MTKDLAAIRVFGDPVLRKTAEALTAVDQHLITLLKNTMRAADGIGLAAPQIGYSKRVIVVAVPHVDEVLTLINPRIVGAHGKQINEEGCLSLPGLYGPVQRSAEIIVEALDEDYKRFVLKPTALFAACIQHEVDHLDGKLFIDYLSSIKKAASLKLWDRIKLEYPDYKRNFK